MYKNVTIVLKKKSIFSLFGRNEGIKILQIYVKIALHATSGRIPVFHCSNANSGNISNIKILISRCYRGVFDKYEDIFIFLTSVGPHKIKFYNNFTQKRVVQNEKRVDDIPIYYILASRVMHARAQIYAYGGVRLLQVSLLRAPFTISHV